MAIDLDMELELDDNEVFDVSIKNVKCAKNGVANAAAGALLE